MSIKHIYIFAGLVIIGAVLVSISLKSPSLDSVNNQVYQEVQDDSLNKVLDIYLDNLAMCESSGKPTAYHPADGGSPSYGLLQFKEATWHAYWDKFEFRPYVERQERMNLIWDGETQLEVARHILKNERNGYKNWYNCSKSIGLDKYMAIYHTRAGLQL